jgi:ATP-dependent protease ClpP protease subunit
MKQNKQAIESETNDATMPIEERYDNDDDYFLDMQEAAELGILNDHRRYVSNRVRKHPFEQ